jgi:hypothetical protein
VLFFTAHFLLHGCSEPATKSDDFAEVTSLQRIGKQDEKRDSFQCEELQQRGVLRANKAAADNERGQRVEERHAAVNETVHQGVSEHAQRKEKKGVAESGVAEEKQGNGNKDERKIECMAVGAVEVVK